MDDLIRRQAVIDALRDAENHAFNSFYKGLVKAHKIIANCPSAQTEIVRCKECINHGKEICYFWSHFYGTINTPDDGFCYKAERRTDG